MQKGSERVGETVCGSITTEVRACQAVKWLVQEGRAPIMLSPGCFVNEQ